MKIKTKWHSYASAPAIAHFAEGVKVVINHYASAKKADDVVAPITDNED
jgi:hypothetical protein